MAYFSTSVYGPHDFPSIFMFYVHVCMHDYLSVCGGAVGGRYVPGITTTYLCSELWVKFKAEAQKRSCNLSPRP